MTLLAPTLQAFFTQHLLAQRRASPNTVAAYRDAWRLLLTFAHNSKSISPSRLRVDNLDAVLIAAFLDHLEHDRAAAVTTRNARLAAIHSLFRFAALLHPDHAALIQQVLAIPAKRADRTMPAFLTDAEIEALLAAPDRTSHIGRRDHAILALAVQTGLRVSELVGLCRRDITLGATANVRCDGKGRKQRCTPLTSPTMAVLRRWLDERGGGADDPLFPGPKGKPLTRDAVRALLSRHVRTASTKCPTLADKAISPHALRHTCAMRLLESGVDTSVIALWLGHESTRTTDIYLHADLGLKERALARTAPTQTKPGRYRPPDPLLAFLESL
jgi:site-specific recombinase XerD